MNGTTFGAALWIAAAAILLAALGFYAQVLGLDAVDEALVLVAAGAVAACAAFVSNGLTGKPILSLSLPLLVGWWIVIAGSLPVVLALAAAALAGAVAGGVAGLLASGPLARTAALTLALAVTADLVSDGFALDRLGQSPAVVGVGWLVGAAIACVALAWWAEGSLAAGLLHHGRTPEAAATLGLRHGRLVVLASLLGGLAGGLAGGMLALGGTGPPDVLAGLVLAAAALGGGGTMAGTLALVGALWILPQLALRAAPEAVDLGLWLAAGVGVAVLAIGLRTRWSGNEDA